MASRRSVRGILAAGLWLWVGAGARAAPAQAHNFVGAQSCASCHAFEYDVWSKGPHARAHQSLTAEQLVDGRCASCHSNVLAAVGPGAGEFAAGGTAVETSVGERDQKLSPLMLAARDPVLLGVQCEQCHGAGKYYQPSYVMRDKALSRALGLLDPTPAGCVACHTEGAPSLEAFDYRTMWGRIDHGREARLRYEKDQQAQAAAAAVPSLEAAAPAASAEAPAAAPSRAEHKERRNRRRGTR